MTTGRGSRLRDLVIILEEGSIEIKRAKREGRILKWKGGKAVIATKPRYYVKRFLFFKRLYRVWFIKRGQGTTIDPVSPQIDLSQEELDLAVENYALLRLLSGLRLIENVNLWVVILAIACVACVAVMWYKEHETLNNLLQSLYPSG